MVDKNYQANNQKQPIKPNKLKKPKQTRCKKETGQDKKE